MQNLIDDVTRRLVSRLPETKAYYSLTDLHDFQIPNFIISRIELELRKNLADSIVPPATDWANMKSSNVKICWDNFIKAIHEQVRLPRSFARSVIEVAVADVLDLLIEPQKNMAEMIFGQFNDLKFEELRHAASYVTVYPYLPESLIKYMHRKQMLTISKAKAHELVHLVDTKMTEKYTPLNWAQLIDPLFVLLGEEIESEVFRLFFLDKGKTRWSEYFDKEKEDISRTRFIEILTLPELDGIEEYTNEYDQSSITSFHSNYGKPSSKLVEEDFSTHDESNTEEELQEEEAPPIGRVRDWGLETNEPLEIPAESNENSESSFNDEVDEEVEPTTSELEESTDEDAETDYRFSTMTDVVEEQDDEDEEFIESVDDENDVVDEAENENETSFVFESNTEVEIDEDDTDNLPIYKKINLNNEPVIDEKPIVERVKVTEEVPFWKRFISTQEEEPVIDLVEEENQKDALDEMLAQLKDMEDEFVTNIFGGEVNAYVEAIEELSRFKHWDEASAYIKQEIFKINRVEIYSESGLDFIERLQSYFNLKG